MSERVNRISLAHTIFGLRKSSVNNNLEEFSKPKIIYNDIAQRLSFALCESGAFLNNTAYFFASYNRDLLLYLLNVLNSKLIDWYYRTISVQLGEKAVRMFSIYVLRIPIPKEIQTLPDDDSVCRHYHLSKTEIAYLKTLED